MSIILGSKQMVRRKIGEQEVDRVYQGDQLIWRRIAGVVNADTFDTYVNGPLGNNVSSPWVLNEFTGSFRINVNNGIVTMGGSGTNDLTREGIAIHNRPTNTDDQLVQVKVGAQGSTIRGTSVIVRSNLTGRSFVGMQIVSNALALYRSTNRSTTVLGPGVQNVPYKAGGIYSLGAIGNNYYCFLDETLLYTYTETSPTVPRGQRHMGFSVQWGRTFFANTISPAVDEFSGADVA